MQLKNRNNNITGNEINFNLPTSINGVIYPPSASASFGNRLFYDGNEFIFSDYVIEDTYFNIEAIRSSNGLVNNFTYKINDVGLYDRGAVYLNSINNNTFSDFCIFETYLADYDLTSPYITLGTYNIGDLVIYNGSVFRNINGQNNPPINNSQLSADFIYVDHIAEPTLYIKTYLTGRYDYTNKWVSGIIDANGNVLKYDYSVYQFIGVDVINYTGVNGTIWSPLNSFGYNRPLFLINLIENVSGFPIGLFSNNAIFISNVLRSTNFDRINLSVENSRFITNTILNSEFIFSTISSNNTNPLTEITNNLVYQWSSYGDIIDGLNFNDIKYFSSTGSNIKIQNSEVFDSMLDSCDIQIVNSLIKNTEIYNYSTNLFENNTIIGITFDGTFLLNEVRNTTISNGTGKVTISIDLVTFNLSDTNKNFFGMIPKNSYITNIKAFGDAIVELGGGNPNILIGIENIQENLLTDTLNNYNSGTPTLLNTRSIKTDETRHLSVKTDSGLLIGGTLYIEVGYNCATNFQ